MEIVDSFELLWSDVGELLEFVFGGFSRLYALPYKMVAKGKEVRKDYCRAVKIICDAYPWFLNVIRSRS